MRPDNDAVEKKHNLGAFPHHGDGDNGGQRGQRSLSKPHRIANRPEFGGHATGMMRHPQDVPAQHDHGEPKDAGGENLLSRTFECIGQGGGENRHETGAGHARADPGGDPTATADDALGCGQDDADDQPGFQGFTKDNNQTHEHAGFPGCANANDLQHGIYSETAERVQGPLTGFRLPSKVAATQT